MQRSSWVILATFVVISKAADPSSMAKLKEIHETTHNECIQKSHVSAQVLSDARAFNFDDNNEKLKDHIYCYCKTIHLADEEDNPDVKTIMKILLMQFDDADFIKSKLKNCLTIKKKIKIDEVYETFKCAILNLKALW